MLLVSMLSTTALIYIIDAEVISINNFQFEKKLVADKSSSLKKILSKIKVLHKLFIIRFFICKLYFSKLSFISVFHFPLFLVENSNLSQFKIYILQKTDEREKLIH